MLKVTVQYAGQPKFKLNILNQNVAQFEQVFGHPTLGDCEKVTTSQIVAVDGDVIETKNTIYVPVQETA